MVLIPFEKIPKTDKGYGKSNRKCKGCGDKMPNANLNRLYCDECIDKGKRG